MDYISRIDGKIITVEVSQHNINGIMLSGGLDSAVMMALIIMAGTTNIQTFTIDKSDGSHTNASRVIHHFNTKFGLSIPSTILVGDPTVHHSIQGATAVKDIIANHSVGLLFNALNRNPPELNNLPSAPKRTTKSPIEMLKLPFVDLYKTHIVDLMYQIGHEDLVDITHSCTEQSVGRCNMCWQCLERKWAFNELNKVDTGTQ